MKDLITSTVIIVLLIFILVFLLLFPGGRQPVSSVPPEQIRTLAATLESQELYEQAVQEYRHYLNIARIPAKQRANLLYRIGTIYLEQLQDYENALAVFLRISHIYPNTPIVRDAEKRMVRCYEEMQRGFDAQKKLHQLTELEPEDEPEGTGPVVAVIGDRKITLDQLERDVAEMPEYLRQNYQTPEKKIEYLRSKLFQELLYDRARRKEYHKDREVRRQLRELEKSILAKKVYEEEIRNQIEITQDDLELYYKAHKSEFLQPKTITVAHIQVETEEKAKAVKQELDEGMKFEEAIETYSINSQTKAKDGVLGDIQEGNDFIPLLGKQPGITEILFELDQASISQPIQGPGGYHIFKVVEVKPEKQYTLQEARRQVEAQLRQMKEQAKQQELLEQMMEAEKVKIFEDVLRSETGNSKG